jgi:hypothetical protein
MEGAYGTYEGGKTAICTRFETRSRPLGRPTLKAEHNIKMEGYGCMGWINLAQDSDT